MIDVIEVRTYKNEFDLGSKPCIRVHERNHLELRARTSIAFIERWGMVAAVPDGEDTTGRQKLRLATPTELVERACVITEQLFSAMDSKGWITELPSVANVEAKFNTNEEEKS